MPSNRVTANTTAQTITTAPVNKKGRITAIHINNRHTASVQVTIQDVYTPQGGSSTTVTKLTLIPVDAGKSLDIMPPKPNIEFLGALQAVASATSTVCEITVEYEWI